MPMWFEAKVAAQDMEVSALFVMGNLKSVKTGAILTVDCNVFKPKETTYNPYNNSVKIGTASMIVIALDALVTVTNTVEHTFTNDVFNGE
jgi:uridine phosphorylase